jgi:membrane-associated phospholipid phosphatase
MISRLQDLSHLSATFLLLAVASISTQAQTTASLPESQQPVRSQSDQVNSPEQPPTPDNGRPTPPVGPEPHGARLQWKDLPRNIWQDQITIFGSPLRINRQNAKWWILFGGATAALIPFDKDITKHTGHNPAEIRAGTWGSRMGADYTVYPLTFMFYVGGKLGDNPRSRDVGRVGIEAMADAEITVNILKLATQRQRPDAGDRTGHFWAGGDSFPSGHSIKSWALASVVAAEFKDKKWVPPLAYGLASSVTLARIAGGRHWTSDALLGSAMGWFIGHYVYGKHHASDAHAFNINRVLSRVDLSLAPIGPVCVQGIRNPYCN